MAAQAAAAGARDRVLALEVERSAIESNIRSALESLGPAGMRAPLVDSEGFPRADVDLYHVRATRQRVIMLKNDLSAKNAELEEALIALHALSPVAASRSATAPPRAQVAAAAPAGVPFAIIDSVAAGSPAAAAGLQPGDKLVSFGSVRAGATNGGAGGGGGGGGELLQAVAALVATSENAALAVAVLRGEGASPVTVSLVPRRWEGRGLLGCHVTPLASS